ncbi:MAG: 50S ribosomal protein L25 [Firmicutes bacterium]|jgi:large subunit ribosomal protein L25|nr:50S ribosomal protein L25 [Bacillota bacterium]
MASLAVKAAARQATGKGPARRARVAGKTPAVMYGAKIAPVALELDARELDRLVEQGALGRLITLELDGETRAVILKDVHRHPIKGTILHADFHAVALDEVLQTVVPVILVGEDERENDGGVVVHSTRELTVECLPTDIPQHLEANVSGLKVGDTLRAGDITMPSGVTLITDPETVVVTVTMPKAVEEETAEEEAEDAETVAEADADEAEEADDGDAE